MLRVDRCFIKKMCTGETLTFVYYKEMNQVNMIYGLRNEQTGKARY